MSYCILWFQWQFQVKKVLRLNTDLRVIVIKFVVHGDTNLEREIHLRTCHVTLRKFSLESWGFLKSFLKFSEIYIIYSYDSEGNHFLWRRIRWKILFKIISLNDFLRMISNYLPILNLFLKAVGLLFRRKAHFSLSSKWKSFFAPKLTLKVHCLPD